MDNERLIGDANRLSCSRDRKGVPEGDAGSSNSKSAERLGFQAVAPLPSSVQHAHCC